MKGEMPRGLGALLHRRRSRPRQVVRGSMRRMIVVKPQDPIFTQALFILRDDYFQTPGVSRRELLRQAQQAARDCTQGQEPEEPQKPSLGLVLPVFSLGAAAAIFAMWLGGII